MRRGADSRRRDLSVADMAGRMFGFGNFQSSESFSAAFAEGGSGVMQLTAVWASQFQRPAGVRGRLDGDFIITERPAALFAEGRTIRIGKTAF